jgi:hypothetical protein
MELHVFFYSYCIAWNSVVVDCTDLDHGPSRTETFTAWNSIVVDCTDLDHGPLRTEIFTACTVHLSIFNSVINQLDAQNFCSTISLLYASTCFEHYVLIIRRTKFYYTTSGIITPIGGCHVHSLREESLNLCT